MPITPDSTPLPGSRTTITRDVSQQRRKTIGRAHARTRRRFLRTEVPLRQRLRSGRRKARRAISRSPRALPGLRGVAGAFRVGYRAEVATIAPRYDTRTIQSLIDQRRYDDVVPLAAALLPERAVDRAFLSTARKAFARAGELTWQLAAVCRMRELEDTASLAEQEVTLAGRLRETDPAWSPGADVLAGVAPITSPVPGRILHLLKSSVPHRQSGYTMRSQYVIDGQRASGLDPVVITFPGFPHSVGVHDAPEVDTVSGSDYHRLLPHENVAGARDNALDTFVTLAAPLVESLAPEVLHAHSGHRGYEGALVALALGRAYGIPVVYEVRGFFESLWSADLDWNEVGELYDRRVATETRCMKEAAAVTTLSESMRAEIVARGVDPARVHVIPNGVDVEAFQPVPRNTDLAESLGLTGAFVFGYVSNLDHFREGHELLIHATERLRATGIPATALIVGDGDRRAELEELAQSVGVTDHVVFTGKVPHNEVLDYYALYDVFVVPRVDERAARLVTPLKPFEAMAAEIPVVVSDLPALREVIGEGTRGRTFAAGDVDALAETLTELHGDPELRAQLAAAGREWVTAERQWSSNGARYRMIYDQVRESPSPSTDR